MVAPLCPQGKLALLDYASPAVNAADARARAVLRRARAKRVFGRLGRGLLIFTRLVRALVLFVLKAIRITLRGSLWAIDALIRMLAAHARAA